MAQPVCTAVALATGCHNLENWSSKQQLALIVYFMVLELAAAGGTNYAATLTSTATGGLLGDAAQVFQTMTADQRMDAFIKIYKNNAVGAGASVPNLKADESNAIKCLVNAKVDQLEQMFLWLTCQLGHHTASN